MKRTFLFQLLLFISLSVMGQSILTIRQKDGQQFSFGFEDKPVVKFTDNEMVVTSTKTELRCALAQMAKFSFDDDKETAVEATIPDSAKAVIALDENTVSIIGAKPDATVCIFASDGKQLQSYNTNQDGIATFSIADLPKGTYIISSESLTVKILKK